MAGAAHMRRCGRNGGIVWGAEAANSYLPAAPLPRPDGPYPYVRVGSNPGMRDMGHSSAEGWVLGQR